MTIRNEGKQKRNIKIKALMIVPFTLGIVIRINVQKLLFPRSFDAISSFSSIPARAEVIKEKATGKFRYTWAIITDGNE